MTYRPIDKRQRSACCGPTGMFSSEPNHSGHRTTRLVSALAVPVCAAPSMIFIHMDDCLGQAENSAILTFTWSSSILMVSMVLHSWVVIWNHKFCNNLGSTTYTAVNIMFYLAVASYFGWTSYFFKTLDHSYLIGILVACILWILLATASLVEVHTLNTCSDEGFHPVKGPMTKTEKYQVFLFVLDFIHWTMFFTSFVASFGFVWGQLNALTTAERGLCVA